MALTFAHVSDLHLPHAPRLTARQRFSKRQLSVWSWRRRRAVQRPEILEALQRELHLASPDHIVVTGDITNFSLPEEFERAARWLADIGRDRRLSVVPGNHDALVQVPYRSGLGMWSPWCGDVEGQFPALRRHGPVSFIALSSAIVTVPLLASGKLGAAQLQRLEKLLVQEAEVGRVRVVLLHHAVADGAASWRKALRDRQALRAVLQRCGAELVLHGHAREARLDALSGPRGAIPCLCVPSSTALPNKQDAAARWHLLRVNGGAERRWLHVTVRQWSVAEGAFATVANYHLHLPDQTLS